MKLAQVVHLQIQLCSIQLIMVVKAFEQKAFNQTKGISMAGSPVFTANTDLTSTFGEVKTLTGVISTVGFRSIYW